MKFVTFLQSLFIPSCMDKRKGMNIFISIAILLLSSLLVALPTIYHYSNDRYNIMETYNVSIDAFKYCIDEEDTLGAFTEEEKNTYNMVYFSDIKKLGIVAGYDGLGYNETLVNGKEYVLKSYYPVKDDDGTITEYKTYYIHLVVDDYDANNDEEANYSIENIFCKNKREEDESFNHILIAFYNDGIIFMNSDDFDEKDALYYNKKTDINFNDATDMTYVSHKLIDLYFRAYIYQATKTTFFYAFLLPLAIAILFSVVFKGPMAPLKGSKEFLAIAAITSIAPTLACFIAGFISIRWSLYAMNYYLFVFIAFYLFVIYRLLKKARFKKDDLNDFNKKFDEGK